MNRKALALLVFGSCLVGPALQPQTAPSREGAGRQNLFMGFSYLFRSYTHTQLNPVSGGMYGWNLEYAFPHALGARAGIMVDVSGHYRPSGFFNPGIYHFMAGPQFSVPAGHSTIFAHALVGGMFASSEVIAQTRSLTEFAAGVGGGLDHRISPRLDWRFNADWIYGGFQTNDTNQISDIVNNNLRFSTGPVLHF